MLAAIRLASSWVSVLACIASAVVAQELVRWYRVPRSRQGSTRIAKAQGSAVLMCCLSLLSRPCGGDAGER
jgi:hypothetical protein